MRATNQQPARIFISLSFPHTTIDSLFSSVWNTVTFPGNIPHIEKMSDGFDLHICCMGAGYVGGPTMAVIAAKCPKVRPL